MMKPEIKQLSDRVQQLTEDERQRRQTAFAQHWYSLTETEQQLGRAALGAFEALKDAGQMTSEEQAQKWLDNLPPDQQAVAKKMDAWEAQYERGEI